MRMRRKPWARPELAASPFFIKEPESLRGSWKSFFEKEQPLYLELGCGKCPFLAEIGLLHPERNFIGIDISADILGVARRNISAAYEKAARNVSNIALVDYNIENIDRLFGEGDRIERIYISFCNPWQKSRHHKRRLTYPDLLRKYADILRESGEIYFKTDNDDLFDASLSYFKEAEFDLIWCTRDLHRENIFDENILTEHEVLFSSQGIPIKAAVIRKK